MSRVVLFFPDHYDARRPGRQIDRQILPLSLAAVGTTLSRDGFEVRIVDQRVVPDWEDRLRDELRHQPIFFGISTMTGVQLKFAMQASAIAREAAPQIPIVWGGVHPSLLPDQTLAHPGVDIVCIGEGDYTAPELARALREGRDLAEVPGLAFKRDGQVRKSAPRPLANVNELPRVDYGVMGDLEPWLVHGVDSFMQRAQHTRTSLAYQSSRGCAHPCGYCYNLVYNEMLFRARTPESVVDEIEDMVRRYRIGAVFLLDDNFFQSKRRVERICEGLLARKIDIAIYNANCRIDYIATYSVDFCKLLRAAGIRELRIGIESGSDSMQQSIDKFHTFEECLVANRTLREAGIAPSYNFMVGFPGEDKSQVADTLKMMSRLVTENPSAHVDPASLFSPYPGTPLFQTAIKAGWKPPIRLEDWVKAEFKDLNVAPTPALSRYLCDVHQFSLYLDPKHLGRLGRLYSRIAHWRVRHGWVRALPEARLRRWVRNGMGFLRRGVQPFSLYREPILKPLVPESAAA